MRESSDSGIRVTTRQQAVTEGFVVLVLVLMLVLVIDRSITTTITITITSTRNRDWRKSSRT